MLAIKPEWFVALLGAYLLFTLFDGVLNRMSRGMPQPMRCAIAVLIVPGVLGKFLGVFMVELEVYVDILLLGGLALLFTVDRRSGALDASTPPWRHVARICGIGVMVLGGLACSAAHAQQPDQPRVVQVTTVKSCTILGSWIQGVGDYRDAGATLEGLLPIIRKRNLEQPPATLAVMIREAKRVYERAQVDADELAGDAFERCILGLLTVEARW